MTARVGIDFGTTNTVVALADRGNFPVIDLGGGGEPRFSVPSLVARCGTEVRVGWEAMEVWDDPSWDVVASPKRHLGVPEPEIGDPQAIAVEIFRRVRDAIAACPHVEGETRLEAMIGVPANANSLQRLRTFEAARTAGFDVIGIVHEPTAAAIEYAHRHPAFGRGKPRRHVAVYDLGGGTFDASVVRVDGDGVAVLRSAGIERLGGDDFDRIIAEIALERARLGPDEISRGQWQRLLLRCRHAKEALQPSSKKLMLDLEDLGAGEVALSSGEVYERCLPLVEETARLLEDVLAASRLEPAEKDALLLVGGGSQMPLVRRRLKERFGTRLRISPHPFASAAIGLAVHAERAAEHPIEERFTRYFGVWREEAGGAARVFDPIFDPDTRLPAPGETLVVQRTYRPMHNIGHFRFEECARLDAAGRPVGHRTPWCEVLFPYDPTLPPNAALDRTQIERSDRFAELLVEETYECDSRGLITVRFRRAEPPLTRSYLLYGPERIAAPSRR